MSPSLCSSETNREKREITKLAAAYKELHPDDPLLNLQSCTAFLKQIEVCADNVDVEPASRLYRNGFTANYRMLFHGDRERLYRTDVLQASVERCPPMLVNGKMYNFTDDVIQNADKLQINFDELGSILKSWNTATQTYSNNLNHRVRQAPTKQPTMKKIRAALTDLDGAWAIFENTYIDELIGIEAAARKPLADAVKHERRMAVLESSWPTTDEVTEAHVAEYRDEERHLFACLAEMNTTANLNGRGRADVNPEPLIAAREVLGHQQNCDLAMEGTDKWTALAMEGEASSVLAMEGSSKIIHMLSQDFIDSFHAMRKYLRITAGCMERVDPHLHKNRGLVVRLEDFEKVWEKSRRYVQDKEMREALDQAAEVIEAAEAFVPDLRRMCLDCDAGFFMVLPRLIWLGFLKDPKHETLLRSLLPDCFSRKDADSCAEEDAGPTAEKTGKKNLQNLIDRFNSTHHLLVHAQQPRSQQAAETATSVVWEILMHRIVLGSDLDDESPYDRLMPSLQENGRTAVEDFMRELEVWSMELQRHCPRDWNGCSEILVQWISGELKKGRQINFCV